MCVISGPIVSVSATKIFAIPSKDGKRQLVAYANSVDSPADNLMILPIPGGVESVRFENVPKELFQQCKTSFALPRGGREFGYLAANCDSAGPDLVIHSHGSYEVVMVPSIADCARIPAHFARPTQEVLSFLQATYVVPSEMKRSRVGFLFCRLRPGAVDYEPFAYSHAIEGGSLFIPTMHFHKHPASPSMEYKNLYDAAFAPVAIPSRRTAHVDKMWDHAIYVAGCAVNPVIASPTLRFPSPKNLVNWSVVSPDFAWGPGCRLSAMEIEGSQIPNQDLVLPLIPMAMAVA